MVWLDNHSHPYMLNEYQINLINWHIWMWLQIKNCWTLKRQWLYNIHTDKQNCIPFSFCIFIDEFEYLAQNWMIDCLLLQYFDYIFEAVSFGFDFIWDLFTLCKTILNIIFEIINFNSIFCTIFYKETNWWFSWVTFSLILPLFYTFADVCSCGNSFLFHKNEAKYLLYSSAKLILITHLLFCSCLMSSFLLP